MQRINGSGLFYTILDVCTSSCLFECICMQSTQPNHEYGLFCRIVIHIQMPRNSIHSIQWGSIETYSVHDTLLFSLSKVQNVFFPRTLNCNSISKKVLMRLEAWQKKRWGLRKQYFFAPLFSLPPAVSKLALRLQYMSHYYDSNQICPSWPSGPQPYETDSSLSDSHCVAPFHLVLCCETCAKHQNGLYVRIRRDTPNYFALKHAPQSSSGGCHCPWPPCPLLATHSSEERRWVEAGSWP